MPITLFANDVVPYFTGHAPYPGEVDEFAWDRGSLLRMLRAGSLKAEFTCGAWVIRQAADGTYSGELTAWRARRARPEPDRFAGLREHEALDIAHAWAYASAGG